MNWYKIYKNLNRLASKIEFNEDYTIIKHILSKNIILVFLYKKNIYWK